MYDKECKFCGTKLSQYYNTGYLGCSDCYKEFEKEITASLKKIQGGVVHVGKKPKILPDDRKLLNDYKLYLEEKERAGLEKRFVDMAKINKILEGLSDELRRRGLL